MVHGNVLFRDLKQASLIQYVHSHVQYMYMSIHALDDYDSVRVGGCVDGKLYSAESLVFYD